MAGLLTLPDFYFLKPSQFPSGIYEEYLKLAVAGAALEFHQLPSFTLAGTISNQTYV